jgi:hypothetical protein
MRTLIGTLVALLLAAPAAAQVQIDIGIHLPAPPPLVSVPEVRTVQYVPAASVNLFFYGGQYWAFANGAWHVSRVYNGPWVVVAPTFVPRPILLVPVTYYHVPPGHWERRAPPHWGAEWGREWSEKREWKDRGDHDRHGKGDEHGRDDGRGKSEGRGRGKGH